jgi:23S rRNA pseudouridine2605 synthase
MLEAEAEFVGTRRKPTPRKPTPRKPTPRKPTLRKPTLRKPTLRKPTPGRRPLPRRGKKPIRVTPLSNEVEVEVDVEVEVESDGKIRLNRFLASAGVCSRRAADDLIRAGRVTVDGSIVTELGTRVDPEQTEVRFDDVRVRPERKVYVLFNKPKGVVCTSARNEQRKRAIDCVEGIKGRVYTVGRLDAESEGLILLTNDGDFAQAISHPSRGVPKTYAVLVRGRLRREDFEKARKGIWLAEGRTGGARMAVQRRGRDRTYLKVTIHEGMNREIRRVFARLGYVVLSLKRVRIGGLTLHGLGAGKYRFLKLKEVQEMLGSSRGKRRSKTGSGRRR